MCLSVGRGRSMGLADCCHTIIIRYILSGPDIRPGQGGGRPGNSWELIRQNDPDLPGEKGVRSGSGCSPITTS